MRTKECSECGCRMIGLVEPSEMRSTVRMYKCKWWCLCGHEEIVDDDILPMYTKDLHRAAWLVANNEEISDQMSFIEAPAQAVRLLKRYGANRENEAVKYSVTEHMKKPNVFLG